MNKNCLLLLTAMSCSLSSCREQFTHEQYLDELVAVEMPVKQTNVLFRDNLRVLKKIVLGLQANNWKGGDTTYIDSIMKTSTALATIRKESIQKIQSLTETDDELKIKEQTIKHLRSIEIVDTFTPHVIRMCRNGVTEADKKPLAKIFNETKEAAAQGNDLLGTLHTFMEKHNITYKELSGKGL